MRIAFLLSTLLTALLILRTANHQDTPAPHATVLHTASYALQAGVYVNAACALAAFATAAVPRGMESDACAPYSVVAVAVTARLHVFGLGGYKPEERRYFWDLATTARKWVLGGPERWFETF